MCPDVSQVPQTTSNKGQLKSGHGHSAWSWGQDPKRLPSWLYLHCTLSQWERKCMEMLQMALLLELDASFILKPVSEERQKRVVWVSCCMPCEDVLTTHWVIIKWRVQGSGVWSRLDTATAKWQHSDASKKNNADRECSLSEEFKSCAWKDPSAVWLEWRGHQWVMTTTERLLSDYDKPNSQFTYFFTFLNAKTNTLSQKTKT